MAILAQHKARFFCGRKYLITNAGNNASLPADTRDLDGDSNITEAIPFDIARNPRVNGTNVDLGAFEFVQNSAPVLYDTTLTVPENSLLNTLVDTTTPTDANTRVRCIAV